MWLNNRYKLTAYGCEEDERKCFEDYSEKYNMDVITYSHPLTVENARIAHGSRCVSVSHKSVVNDKMLRALEQNGVRYILTRSIGINHIDTKAAAELNIEVSNISYAPDSVAEYTVMLMLMATRNMKFILNKVRLQNYTLDSVRPSMLSDMTIGVIGTGHIGRAVISRLKAFGCRVLAYDSYQSPGIDYVSLAKLLKESDVVTLHIPLMAETVRLINEENISKMKQGAYLINTGRGALIDTEALLAALRDGRLSGAALDVVEGEENLFYHDLRNVDINNTLIARLCAMPNVIVTPHTAFYTQRTLKDTIEDTLKKCVEYEGRKEKWIS